jgi:hypothetical protein
MRIGGAARVGLLAVVIMIMACTSTASELTRADLDDVAREQLDQAEPVPAASELEAQTSTESAADPDEASASRPAIEPGIEAPTHPGRLCSRPYGISSTPGKGAATREDSQAERAAARRRLAQGFEVRVDDLERQAWTPELGVEFDRLDPSVDHVIEIFDAKGRRVRRLSLDFARRGSDDICLSFETFYTTWQLRALAPGARCGPCVTR